MPSKAPTSPSAPHPSGSRARQRPSSSPRLMRVGTSIFAFVVAVALRSPGAAIAASDVPVHCVFSASYGSAFLGTCPLVDETPRFTLSIRTAPEGGIWRPDASPRIVWGGQMADEDSATWQVQLQIFRGNSGILQTVYGWFPVMSYEATAGALSFDVDGQKEVPPNALDAKIVKQASEILSSAAVWNRNDTRKCPPSATTFSIYCAGEKAVEEVTGGTGLIDHRRPAMEVIREVVEDRAAGRNYKHRLMEYNNDPRTTMDDVRSVFSDALERMSDISWLQNHGFAKPSAP